MDARGAKAMVLEAAIEGIEGFRIAPGNVRSGQPELQLGVTTALQGH